MNNRVLASLILVSFAMIFLGMFAGEYEDFFYGFGALGSMIFFGFGLYRLSISQILWFPYVGGTIFFLFWFFTFTSSDKLESLAFPYLIAGLYTAIKLYKA